MTPEHKLWSSLMMVRINDAIYPFEVPKGVSIDEQEKRFWKNPRKYENTLFPSGADKLDQERAYIFLESSEFNEVADFLGYEDRFVNQTFAFVQDVISRRKKLRDKLIIGTHFRRATKNINQIHKRSLWFRSAFFVAVPAVITRYLRRGT